MKVIYKNNLAIVDRQPTNVPINSEFLSAQMQGVNLCLWYKCDPELELVSRFIRIYGTGHPITVEDSKLKYISTFQMQGGALIFHVFEELP